MQIAYLGSGLWINIDAIATIHDENDMLKVVMVNSDQHELIGDARQVMLNLLAPTVRFWMEQSGPAAHSKELPPQITESPIQEYHDPAPPTEKPAPDKTLEQIGIDANNPA